MDAEILQDGLPATAGHGLEKAGPGTYRVYRIRRGQPGSRHGLTGCSNCADLLLSLSEKTGLYIAKRWLLLILYLSINPSTGYAVCDPCTAPDVGEWTYRANNCWYSIPPSYGYRGNEAGIVEAVEEAMAYCNSGFNETRWVDLEYPDSIYLGHTCGGGDEYPGYSSSFHLEDHNYRTIGTVTNCDGYGIHRIRDIFCPPGTYIQDGLCKAQPGVAIDDKNFGKPDCKTGGSRTAGNPVNVAFANKVQVETDLEPSPQTGLGITRTYNSNDVRDTRSYRFGKGWHSGYDRSIRVVEAAVDTAYLVRPDARTWYFTYTNGLWQADADIHGTLTTTPTGWQYLNERDETEDYDPDGRLTRLTKPSGIIFEYTYNPANVVESVTTNLGESLSFTYDANRRIRSITDHTGRTWQYQYDANDNLAYVIYPDGTPLDDADNPVRRYHYEDPDFPNALTGITDERGIRYANFEYDSYGQPVASYHGPLTGDLTDRIDGITLAYNGTQRTVTNSKGVPSTYTTATQVGVALVTGISGPGCASCGSGNSAYSYDPVTNDLLTKTVNGLTTEYGGYDANGNPGYRIEALGTAAERRTDYTYDPRYFGRIATITEPSVYPGQSKVTTYGYDDFGNRTSRTVSGFAPDGTPVSRTITWQFNGPLHQLTQIDGPRTDVSDTTSFRYYPDDPGQGAKRARLKEIEDATGTLTRSSIQYTPTGKIASENRPNSLQLTYTYYPGNDRLETLAESVGTTTEVTRWTYLATGEVKTITTADGTPDATTVTFTYDDARRLARVTDGLGNYIEYTLDTEGNRVGEDFYDSVSVLRKALTRTFDLYNRLDTTSQANERVDFDYAPDGTLDQQTDGKGSVTAYSYDALKRLLNSTQDLNGLGAVTAYAYDKAGNLTSITDSANGNTTYVYDDLGNLLSATSPDTGITVYTYDAAGNLKSRVDALGQLFFYSYDVLNRLSGLDAPGTVDDIIYGYDSCPNGTGRLCSVIPPTTILTYAYDAFGNITSHQGLAYTYDAANRLKTITYLSGAVVSYQYDAAGQVSQVDLSAGGTTTTLAREITYAPFGSVESLAYGNGATLTQSLDSAYRLTSQSIPGVLELGYTAYDGNGDLETRTDPYSATGSFAYDSLNRLDTASGTFGSRDYDYDLNGNRTTLVSDGATTTYGYTPSSNRLVAEDDWTYTLDANGNTTGRLNSDGSGEGRSFEYNGHNRLTGVTDHRLVTRVKGHKQTITLQDKTVATYAYNGLGQRAGKVVEDAESRQFLYGTDGTLLTELDGTGGVIREYVYINSQLLAVLDQGAALNEGGDEVILDNGTAPAGWTARTGNKAYGTDYLYSTGDSGNAVRWTPVLEAGVYEVYTRWLANRNYSSTVPYTIGHDGETDTVVVDQTGDGGKWQLLGSYVFAGTGNEYIEVSDSGGKTTADAVRLVRQGGVTGGGTFSVYYVHNDHLGTPQAMTDQTGNTVWRAAYDPFGVVTVDEDPDEDGTLVTLNVRFPGQYYDEETGLYYNYFRIYDPGTGRYMTADPIGLIGGLNTYLYSNANPLRYIDPLGLDTAGCDVIPDFLETPCRLECCARHDECFDKYKCAASSWYKDCATEDCKRCNKEVKDCFIDCGFSKQDDPDKANYYCAILHKYVKIPGNFPTYQAAKLFCSTD